MQFGNGNALSLTLPFRGAEMIDGNDGCGCQDKHRDRNESEAKGGDTWAKSGDAYGGDGGDAKAIGGDAEAWNAVEAFQFNGTGKGGLL